MIEALALCILMALAAYRLWRLFALDSWPPVKRARDWLEEQEGPGWYVVAELVFCAWCGGAWISFAVVGLTDAFTSVPLVGLQIAAVSTIVGWLGSELQ